MLNKLHPTKRHGQRAVIPKANERQGSLIEHLQHDVSILYDGGLILPRPPARAQDRSSRRHTLPIIRDMKISVTVGFTYEAPNGTTLGELEEETERRIAETFDTDQVRVRVFIPRTSWSETRASPSLHTKGK
jgi:hypothetical protein